MGRVKQRKRNDVPLGNRSRVVRVQVVPAVVPRQQSRGAGGIPYRSVEIDDSIEFTAAAHPRVDRLPGLLIIRTIKAVKEGLTEECLLEWRDRCSNRSNSVLVGARYKLSIARYQILRSDRFACGYERAREQNVVHAHSKDHVLDACLRQHVAFEARQARLPEKCPDLLKVSSQWRRTASLVGALAIT